MSGFLSRTAAVARSIASSMRSLSLTVSPLRLLNILRSLPSTLPNATWMASVGGCSQPAIRATANTISRCWACGAPTTYSSTSTSSRSTRSMTQARSVAA